MNKICFTNAVNRNNQRLFLLAMSYLHNHDDSEDILQNCFLKLWTQDIQWESDDHIDKWLTIVCINECKNVLTGSTRTRWTSIEEAKNIYKFDSDHDASVYEAVMSLPESESVAIHMFYYEGYSIKDISKLLDISESAVKVRLHRGREKLSGILQNPFEE